MLALGLGCDDKVFTRQLVPAIHVNNATIMIALDLLHSWNLVGTLPISVIAGCAEDHVLEGLAHGLLLARRLGRYWSAGSGSKD